MDILEFKGEYAFLSNFWYSDVILYGETYSSVETAYQSAKSMSKEERDLIRIMKPGEAKKFANKIELRPNWESVKIPIMKNLVMQKFSKHSQLKEKLLSTVDSILVEGNYWHDNFWGTCYCPKCKDTLGLNHLGKILMNVRNMLK